MFVNFSPADYNSDETSTSLMYAARVKKIVNNASKVLLLFVLPWLYFYLLLSLLLLVELWDERVELLSICCFHLLIKIINVFI